MCKPLTILIVIMIVSRFVGVAGAQAQPGAATTQPVDFRQLKDLLPDAVGGLRQTSADGETTTSGDATLSSASADYSGAEDRADAPQVRVQIVDYAAAPHLAAAVAAAWSAQPRDGDRAFHLAGHPAHERYDAQSKTGELEVFVAHRFIVTISTTNLPSDQIARIGESLPLADLVNLK